MTPNAIDGWGVEQLRAIDALVAEKVMGWKWYSHPVGRYGLYRPNAYPPEFAADHNIVVVDAPKDDGWHIDRSSVPHYTTDGNAMLEVIGKMENPGSGWIIEVRFKHAITVYPPTQQQHVAVAPTLPLAVCLAALRAVGVEVKP